ncbi:MAG: zinc ribbon domain-containing protein [Planctomycetota bacterium]|nr:zinc ribbon domain-containing protein [Planctomycetota bacterium]
MPLYEYDCKDCNSTVEVLVRSQEEKPECPDCGSVKLKKILSVAAAPNMNGTSLPTAAEGGNCGRAQCQSGCMFD